MESLWGEKMFRKLYFMLFNRVTDAIRALEAGDPALARQLLIHAQRECEEYYLRDGPGRDSGGE